MDFLQGQLFNLYSDIVLNSIKRTVKKFKDNDKLEKPLSDVLFMKTQIDFMATLRVSLSTLESFIPMIKIIYGDLDEKYIQMMKEAMETIYELLKFMEDKYTELMKEIGENQPPKMQQFYQRLDALLLSPDLPEGKELLSKSKDHFESVEPNSKRRRLSKTEEADV